MSKKISKVGEDDKYYYVAESLWTTPNVGVVIIPYSKKNLFKKYYYVMLVDSYYKEDGKLTKLWYWGEIWKKENSKRD